MQSGGIGEKEARALELFRQLNEADRRLFIMMGWDVFTEAAKIAIVNSGERRKIEVIEVN